eukprot:907327-Amphidinium_carterae.1
MHRKYFASYFILDATVVACDWFSLITSELSSRSTENLATINMVRLVRLSRLLRLLALARLIRIVHRVRNMNMGRATLTGNMMVGIYVIKVLAGCLLLNHILSCGWYMVGTLHADTGETWLDLEGGVYRDTRGVKCEHSGWSFKCLMRRLRVEVWCIIRSLTQMTPGSMQVNPQNSYERVWTVMCMLIGLLFSTALVGQLSSKFVQYDMGRQETIRQMEMLRRFLRENKINQRLAARIHRQIEDRMTIGTRLTEDD